MRNPCQKETLLSAFIDDELEAAETQRVGRHLKECAPCRQLLADLKATDNIIQGISAAAPSADFERNFWQKAAKLEDKRGMRRWSQILLPVWRPKLVAGLAVGLIAGVLIFTGSNIRVSPEDQFMADNVEFLNDYDLISDLDMLENWDVIVAMEELS